MRVLFIVMALLAGYRGERRRAGTACFPLAWQGRCERETQWFRRAAREHVLRSLHRLAHAAGEREARPAAVLPRVVRQCLSGAGKKRHYDEQNTHSSSLFLMIIEHAQTIAHRRHWP